jgi:hypothetical protein
MGGLIARYWIGPGDAASLCAALITLGTPHRGAPKALDILANGIAVKRWHTFRKLRDVLRGWPSVAELLPRYPAITDVSAPLAAEAGRLLYPYQLPLSWCAETAAAYRTHLALDAAWEKLPRTGTMVVPRIGYGHATMRACSWDGTKVTVSKDAPASGDLGAWVDDLGDGTVPAYCGLPVEMNQPPDDFLIRSRHGELGVLDEVATLVARWDRRAPLTRYRGAERPPVLGLDIDEIQIAGETFTLTAALHGLQTSPGAAVWARLAVADSAPVDPVDVRLAFDESSTSFVGELPALTPGSYELRVAARELPGAGDVVSSTVIEVFDDDDLD